MRWWQKLHGDDILVQTLQPRSALSLDDDVRSLLGDGPLDWAHALAVEVAREYVDVLIPELARSVDFTQRLQISAESNVLGILLALGSHESDVQPPREALDFAREAALQQVPLVAVLRGYRLGVEHWLRWCTPAIARHTHPASQAAELQLAVMVAVRYIDKLSENVIVAYERELQRRATSGAAHRAALVRAILANEEVDVDDTSDLLHYPLRGRHVALSLRARSDSTNQVEALETEARSFAASVGATGLLTIATGFTTMDAWVAVAGEFGRPTRPLQKHVNIGVGTSHSDVPGFIQSHRESQRALEVLELATPGRLDLITYYDRVRLVSLIVRGLQDLQDLQEFVTDTLGRLAHTDGRSRELRETLLAFFEANKSYATVARSTHLHKNTVVQRVTRANDLTGRDMTNHIDVHIALMLADVLGERVLADIV